MTLRAVCCFNLAFNIFKERDDCQSQQLTDTIFFYPTFKIFAMKIGFCNQYFFKNYPLKGTQR